jgi:hypothetical protein
MPKWIVWIAIAAMAGVGFALPKTMATRPVDGAPHQAQASFARVAASRCSKRGANRSCRTAPRTEKRSARSILPNLMIGIGF